MCTRKKKVTHNIYLLLLLKHEFCNAAHKIKTLARGLYCRVLDTTTCAYL